MLNCSNNTGGITNCEAAMEVYNISENNSDVANTNITMESLSRLNSRYATALLPVTIVLGMLGFIGIVGNILVFYVYGFGKTFKDKKFRCYVLVLAIIDFTTCLTLIPAEIWKHQSYFNFEETILCKLKCFFNVFAASSASYCLFIVAVDRYILTCHPFLFVKIRTFSYNAAWPLCILMIFLGVLTAVPAAFLCGKSTETMTDINGHAMNVYLCSLDPFYETGVTRYIYRISLCVTQTLLNTVMIVLYVQIGLAVKKVMTLREEASHNCLDMNVAPRNMPRTTNAPVCTSCNTHHAHIPTNVKLMFLITVVFIVTYFLYMGLSWVDQTKLSPLEFATFSIFFRLYFIYSVINPFLYAKMDRYFRKRCLRLLRREQYY